MTSEAEAEELGELMEQLRQRASAIPTFPAILANVNANIMDKRSVLDAKDREQIKSSLAFLQKRLKVHDRKDLFVQLREIANTSKLQWSCEGENAESCRLSSGDLAMDVRAEPDGTAEVSLAWGGGASSPSPLLSTAVNKGDWDTVSQHLNRLAKYLPADFGPEERLTLTTALGIVEDDLAKLSLSAEEDLTLASFNESPVGLLRPRDAAQAARIHFFAGPYDFLDLEKGKIVPPTAQDILDKSLGVWGELEVEASPEPQLLPTKSVLSATGKSSAVTESSGKMINGRFVLKFSSPIPVLASTIDLVEEVTGLDCTKKELGSVVEELVKKAGRDSRRHSLFVVFPDEEQEYGLEYCESRMHGALLTAVPFIHPSHVLKIVALLRPQLLWNTLVSSCVRAQKPKRSSLPRRQFVLSIVSEHRLVLSAQPKPGASTIVTGELELRGLETTLKLKCSDDSYKAKELVDVSTFATDKLKKSWSIPVTMRAAFNKLGLAPESDDGDGKDDKPGPGGDDGGGGGGGGGGGHGGGDGGGRGPKPGSRPFDSSNPDPSFWLQKPKPASWATRQDSTATSVGPMRTPTKDNATAWRPQKTPTAPLPAAWRPRTDPRFFPSSPSTSPRVSYAVHDVPLLNGDTSLLDIFKEFEVWKELVPPRADQSPIKSPTQSQRQAEQQMAAATAASFPPVSNVSRLEEMLSGPMASQQPAGPGLLRGRHMLQSSSSSDNITSGELDCIAALSQSLTETTTPRQASPPPLPPPAPIQQERKSSIDGVIDAVVASGSPANTFPATSPAPPPFSDASGRPMMHSPGTPYSTTPSSIFPPPLRPPYLQHSKSTPDPEHMMQQQGPPGYPFQAPFSARAPNPRSLEVFDFKEEVGGGGGVSSVYADGSIGLERPPSQGSGYPMGFPYPHGMPGQPVYPGTSASPTPGMGGAPMVAVAGPRGGRGGRGSRGPRRSRKTGPANLGDRAERSDPSYVPGAAPRKRGGTGTRRPRKPRGAAGLMHSSTLGGGPGPPLQLPPAESPSPSTQSSYGYPGASQSPVHPSPTGSALSAPSPQTGLPLNSPSHAPSFPDAIDAIKRHLGIAGTAPDEPPAKAPRTDAPGPSSRPTGLEESEEEAEAGGDAGLRKVMQDFLQGGGEAGGVDLGPLSPQQVTLLPASTAQPAAQTKPKPPLEGNIFEKISSTSKTPKAEKPMLGKATSSRKNSLENIVGKLKGGEGSSNPKEEPDSKPEDRKEEGDPPLRMKIRVGSPSPVTVKPEKAKTGPILVPATAKPTR